MTGRILSTGGTSQLEGSYRAEIILGEECGGSNSKELKNEQLSLKSIHGKKLQGKGKIHQTIRNIVLRVKSRKEASDRFIGAIMKQCNSKVKPQPKGSIAAHGRQTK